MWSFYLRKVIPTDALFKNYVIRKLGLTETDLKYDKNNKIIYLNNIFIVGNILKEGSIIVLDYIPYARL